MTERMIMYLMARIIQYQDDIIRLKNRKIDRYTAGKIKTLESVVNDLLQTLQDMKGETDGEKA